MLNTVSLKFTCNSGVLVLLLAQAYFKKNTLHYFIWFRQSRSSLGPLLKVEDWVNLYFIQPVN